MDGDFSRQYDYRERRNFPKKQRKQDYRENRPDRTGRERKTVNENSEWEEFEFEIEIVDLLEDFKEDRDRRTSGREESKRPRTAAEHTERTLNRTAAARRTDSLRRTGTAANEAGRDIEIRRASNRTGRVLERRERRETGCFAGLDSRADRAPEAKKTPNRGTFAGEAEQLSFPAKRTSKRAGQEPKAEGPFFRLSQAGTEPRGGKSTDPDTAIVRRGAAGKNIYKEAAKMPEQRKHKRKEESIPVLSDVYGTAVEAEYSAAASIEAGVFDTDLLYQEDAADRRRTAGSGYRRSGNRWKGQKRLTKEEWIRRRKQQVFLIRCLVASSAVLILVGAGWLAFQAVHILRNFEVNEAIEELTNQGEEEKIRTRKVKVVEQAPDFSVQLLTVNEYSRPAIPTEKIENIVIHYTANPGTTAQQNRDFFESLKETHETSVSSHFVIGIEGEIIQCIPTKERAYASNNRNYNTVSIENCHLDKSGRFTQETYDSLVALSAWLCGKFNLTPDDIIRHYDVTGKVCPKYYVENEGAWALFIEDVREYIDQYGVEKEIPADEEYYLKNE